MCRYTCSEYSAHKTRGQQGMNTAYKLYSYTGMAAQFYSGVKTAANINHQNMDEPQQTVAQASEYNTNFLDLPQGFKIGG